MRVCIWNFFLDEIEDEGENDNWWIFNVEKAGVPAVARGDFSKP
jgi:hypothetical protein